MSKPEDAPVKPGMMSLVDAMDAAEDMPDGAYFCMVEELSGYSPGELAEWSDEYTEVEE